MGDEPEDLALGHLLLGRLLISTESTGLDVAARRNGGVPARGSAEMRWSDGGRPPLIRFPRKGMVPSATDLDGESAEWILRRAAVGEDRRWLLSLAGIRLVEIPGRPSAGPPGPEPSAAALRDIRVLLASARRSAAHDLRYAFEVLAGSAEEVRTDRRLRAFREEVNRAVGVALKSRPVFGWRIAVIVYHSAEAVEDIVAARWRDRLANRVVLAANPGYEGGLVSYSFRSGKGVDASGIIASALPARSPAPRLSPDGTAGRGMLQQDRFDELLTALKIKR